MSSNLPLGPIPNIPIIPASGRGAYAPCPATEFEPCFKGGPEPSTRQFQGPRTKGQLRPGGWDVPIAPSCAAAHLDGFSLAKCTSRGRLR